MGEGAAQVSAPARPLDLAAAAHGGVLPGDGEKLEQDALRLKRAGHQLRVKPEILAPPRSTGSISG
jgi:hypothetical protein